MPWTRRGDSFLSGCTGAGSFPYSVSKCDLLCQTAKGVASVYTQFTVVKETHDEAVLQQPVHGCLD